MTNIFTKEYQKNNNNNNINNNNKNNNNLFKYFIHSFTSNMVTNEAT